MLLEMGADVNSMDKLGFTALKWAVALGRENNARLLLDNGADIEAECTDGERPLHSAAWLGNDTMIQLLLEKGADVYSKNWILFAAGWYCS